MGLEVHSEVAFQLLAVVVPELAEGFTRGFLSCYNGTWSEH